MDEFVVFGDARLPKRFWIKVDPDGPVPVNRPDLGPCWLWIASLDEHGYGQFGVLFPGGHRPRRAHRVAYEALIAPIPNELVSDHLCRTARCVNPAHIEPVPQRINLMRGESFSAVNSIKTHCPHGHAYDAENTHFEVATGQRKCRACGRLRKQRYREAHPEEAKQRGRDWYWANPERSREYARKYRLKKEALS